jgi:hypothetical protein
MNLETVRHNLIWHVGSARSGDSNLQLHWFTQDGFGTGQDRRYVQRISKGTLISCNRDQRSKPGCYQS